MNFKRLCEKACGSIVVCLLWIYSNHCDIGTDTFNRLRDGAFDGMNTRQNVVLTNIHYVLYLVSGLFEFMKKRQWI